jgi:hypothetical protein
VKRAWGYYSCITLLGDATDYLLAPMSGYIDLPDLFVLLKRKVTKAGKYIEDQVLSSRCLQPETGEQRCCSLVLVTGTMLYANCNEVLTWMLGTIRKFN